MEIENKLKEMGLELPVSLLRRPTAPLPSAPETWYSPADMGLGCRMAPCFIRASLAGT